VKKLPARLFAKIEHDSGNSYFIADTDVETLVEKGEKVQIGTYELVETSYAESVVSMSKPVKRAARRG
jgi:hypothetical protein